MSQYAQFFFSTHLEILFHVLQESRAPNPICSSFQFGKDSSYHDKSNRLLVPNKPPVGEPLGDACKKLTRLQKPPTICGYKAGTPAAPKGPPRTLQKAVMSGSSMGNGKTEDRNDNNEQQPHRPSDSAVTATLFLVCAVYMFLVLPDSVMEFCHMYQIGPEFPDSIMFWTTVLFNFYFVINPLLYYFSNKYFQCYINNIFRRSAIWIFVFQLLQNFNVLNPIY